MAALTWIGVVNNFAGRFKALRIAQDVARQVGPDMVLYETAAGPRDRLLQLKALISSKFPSEKRPLRILAFGGDRTLNDALLAVMHHIFPRQKDLIQGKPEEVFARMQVSGIQLGTLQLGGANDVGSVHGSPSDKMPQIMDYLAQARLTELNMGLGFLLGQEVPTLFCHSLSCGTTIATVYEKTIQERGISAKIHREMIFLMNMFRRSPVLVKWKNADGSTQEQLMLEALVHATIRADGKIGLPGTPQPGLGIKIFPHQGLWRTLKLFAETLSRGLSSLHGDPKKLLPGQKLDAINPLLQLALNVGEEREFSFFGAKSGEELPVSIQGNGDFIARASQVRILAQPPFPRFLVYPGSLMSRYHAALPPAPQGSFKLLHS